MEGVLMKYRWNQIISAALACFMLAGSVPVHAYAEGEGQPTPEPTQVIVTQEPTQEPTAEPTQMPEETQAPDDALMPVSDTDVPTQVPETQVPSNDPTQVPETQVPSNDPTLNPETQQPSNDPTLDPETQVPSNDPTLNPETQAPSDDPTLNPETQQPSEEPTQAPETPAPAAISISADRQACYVGDSFTIQAVSNLPGDAKLVYDWSYVRWASDTVKPADRIASDKVAHTPAEAEAGARIAITAYCQQYEAVSETIYVDILGREEMAAPAMTFDYEREVFIITPAAGTNAYWTLEIYNDTAGATVFSAEAGDGSAIECALGQMPEGANSFTVLLKDGGERSVAGSSITLERMQLTPEQIAAANVQAIGNAASCAEGYELRLAAPDGTIVKMVDGRFANLQPGVEYALQLRMKASNAEMRLASAWAVIDPAFTVQAPALSAAVEGMNGENESYAGDILDAELTNTDAAYVLPEDVVYGWMYDDAAGQQVICRGSWDEMRAYAVTAADRGHALRFFAESAAEGWVVASENAIEISDIPVEVKLDYEKEILTIRMDDGEGYDFSYGEKYVENAASADIRLADVLQNPLSTNAPFEVRILDPRTKESHALAFSLKKRPAFDGAKIVVTPGEITGSTVHLTSENAAYQCGLVVNGSMFWADESGMVSGMVPDSRAEYLAIVRRYGSNVLREFASAPGMAVDAEGNRISVHVQDEFYVELLYNTLGETDPVQYTAAAPLADAQQAIYEWYAVDLAGNETKFAETTGDDYFINLTQQQQKDLFFSQVKVVVKDLVTGSTASDVCDVFHVSGLTAAIDFRNETLIFTAPAAPAKNCSFSAGSYSGTWPAGETRFSVSLDAFGLPRTSAAAIIENCRLAYRNHPVAVAESITAPMRPLYNGGEAAVKETSARGIVLERMEGVEFALSEANASAPDMAWGISSDSFGGLIAGMEYRVWMRNKATDAAFASAWKPAQITVATALAPVEGYPQAQIDFINEKIIITAPAEFTDAALPEWHAVLDVNGAGLTGSFNAGERSRTLSLKLLNLPTARNEAGYVYLERDAASESVQQSRHVAVTIPARPAFRGDVSQITVKKEAFTPNSMVFSCTEGYQVVLRGKNGYIYPAEGSSFTGLEAGTEYEVYVRNPATETCFASEPKALNAVTATLPFSIAVDKQTLHPGETVTATLSTGGVSYPDLVYTWYIYGRDGMKIAATGANRTKYTATAADVGAALIVDVQSISAGLYAWTRAAEIKAAPTPTPLPTMPVASDQPLNPTASPSASPTATISAYGGNWGTASGVIAEPEADGQGYDEAERLYDNYLVANHGRDSIVVDADGEPVDYEFIPVYCEPEFGTAGSEQNTLLVAAQPDMEGYIVPRSLRLQLSQLQHMSDKKELRRLLFRNGDADVSLNMAELLSGDIAKLVKLMLESQVKQVDPLDIDFEDMDDVQLSYTQLADTYLEVCINPLPLDEENFAWQVEVWLRTKAGVECDISNLLYDFMVCLNVNGLFAEGCEQDYAAENTVALIDADMADDGQILLDSEILRTPDDMYAGQDDIAEYFCVVMPYEGSGGIETYYEAAMPVEYYRNYALASYYAGPGAYMLAELVEEF